MFDLVFVTYNSEKWIYPCFSSIINSDYDLKKLNIIVIDNASSDRTVILLKNLKFEIEKKFNSLKIVKNTSC